MTNSELNKIILVILIAISVGFAVNSFVTKSALKEIQEKIEETSQNLKNVSKNVGHVIYSLESSTQNIDSILFSLEKSKELMDELSKKTGALTRSEKDKIEQSIIDLEKTRNEISQDKDAALELIEILNNTISDE